MLWVDEWSKSDMFDEEKKELKLNFWNRNEEMMIFLGWNELKSFVCWIKNENEMWDEIEKNKKMLELPFGSFPSSSYAHSWNVQIDTAHHRHKETHKQRQKLCKSMKNL